ncbi:DUF4249 domain-containing protein [Fodinibius salsisoli]|uniref:DUF4249 domain-containing protein n=1 Tax=Fodinibius salsisoli TaxID=2820877 RepID=A0ABT3PNP0_9BACT|nr:DUF4249 domain-containing protein [Fodinibius salsisoli]MCW9707476.1 DUF4249 domain-containing protein [Fodinibius salsisoli]
MMRKIVGMLISVTCLWGCENVVQLDVPNKENQLVVNSLFHPDSTFGVSLSQSQFVLDNGEFKKVSGATVKLTDEEGDELTTMQEGESGIYTSDLKPQSGRSYQIKVSKEGFPSATATGNVPADSAMMTKYEVKRNSSSQRFINLSIWLDDSNSEDYYQLYGKQKITLYGEEIDTTTYEHELFFSSDDPVFGEEVNGQRRLLLDDVLFNGKTYKINLSTTVGSTQCSPMSEICDQETEVILYIRKLSEAYFKYMETLSLQDNLSENPFAEPVPVYDNIENGVGIFGGYKVSEYPIEVPEN